MERRMVFPSFWLIKPSHQEICVLFKGTHISIHMKNKKERQICYSGAVTKLQIILDENDQFLMTTIKILTNRQILT